jgi:serine/threonine protein kinase
MIETGRIIQRRYLLQRLIQQGQCCAVYQGTDQVLQRAVAIKVVPIQYVSAYRAAIRQTSQFSHPNIVGIYDLITESETLYVIQEYVDGVTFATLLQMQLSTYEVVDLGMQICQALLYAGSNSRKTCHGDLTPTAILRDRRGLVRVNNFALPGDLTYFTQWSVVGGDSVVVADSDLLWGQQTDRRQADDTRALGLLLYQLLAGRAPGTLSVEPPADGCLRFARNTPPEVCELVARAIIRQHPRYISKVETLYSELKGLLELLEVPIVAQDTYQPEVPISPRQFSPAGTGKLVNALPVRDSSTTPTGTNLPAFLPAANTRVAAMDPVPVSPTVADPPLKLVSVRDDIHAQEQARPRRISFPLLLLLGLLVFALFFAVGYFIATTVWHP